MPFFLDGNPTPGEISEAVNYVLANLNDTVVANQGTGQIIGPSGEITGYLYKYISVKYADSFDGTLNFSNSPTNRLYYGLRNSDTTVESTNPADYVWNAVTGGFGTTKFLYYITTGGRTIQFAVATSVPNTGWFVDSGAAIDLDFTTASSAVANFVVIRVANNSAPPTDAECIAAIGRTPISGDLCTVNYNSGIASIVYKYTTGWAVFQKYITGDLIVANSIVGNNIAANTITAANIAANTITATQIAAATISAANMAANSITAANAAIADAAITSAKIGNLQVNTLQIANNAVSYSSGAASGGSGANTTVFMNAGDKVFVSGFVSGSTSVTTASTVRTVTLTQNGTTFESLYSWPFAGPALDSYWGAIPIAGTYIASSSGNVTFQINYNQNGGGATGIFLIGLRK
jgi:hypothetical protein